MKAVYVLGMKMKKFLLTMPDWMFNALKAEKKGAAINTSVNRLIVEALLDKYRNIAVTVNKE